MLLKNPAVNGRSEGADANRPAGGDAIDRQFCYSSARRAVGASPSDLPFTAGHYDGPLTTLIILYLLMALSRLDFFCSPARFSLPVLGWRRSHLALEGGAERVRVVVAD